MSEVITIKRASDSDVRLIYIEGVLCRRWCRSIETLPQAMVQAFRAFRCQHHTPEDDVVCLSAERTH